MVSDGQKGQVLEIGRVWDIRNQIVASERSIAILGGVGTAPPEPFWPQIVAPPMNHLVGLL